MKGVTFDVRKNALGAVLFACAIVGGGASSGLATDAILQILVLVASFYALTARETASVKPHIRYLMGAALLITVYQLTPVPQAAVDWLRPERLSTQVDSSIGFLTLDIGRTLTAAVYAVCLLIFCRAVLSLNPRQVVGLLPFLLAGVACNGLVGLLQFSLSEIVAVEGLLPYTLSAGFFANQNHFATLLFVAIPFLVFLAIYKEKALLGFLSVTALLLVLFAAGSRAGVLIGLAIAVTSLIFLGTKSRSLNLFTFGTLAVLAVFVIGAYAQLETQELDPDFGRAEFARSTLAGIRENWITGVGYGTFPNSYGMYEDEGMIFQLFVNHAHNDYLEIIFEGGALAAIAIFVFVSLFLFQIFVISNEPFKKAAFLSIFFILIHSLVDYPLRTMAISMSFSYFVAVVFYGNIRFRPKPYEAETEIMAELAPSRNSIGGLRSPLK